MTSMFSTIPPFSGERDRMSITDVWLCGKPHVRASCGRRVGLVTPPGIEPGLSVPKADRISATPRGPYARTYSTDKEICVVGFEMDCGCEKNATVLKMLE